MTTLYITIGVPGSGKTSWANKFAQDIPGIQVLSRDDLRVNKTGKYQYDPEHDVILKDKLRKTAIAYMKDKLDVVITDTNLRAINRGFWYFVARQCKADYVAVWVNTPFDLCMKRNAERPTGRQVPEDVMMQMFNNLEPPTMIEGFSKIIEV
jgi:predicted kinase